MKVIKRSARMAVAMAATGLLLVNGVTLANDQKMVMQTAYTALKKVIFDVLDDEFDSGNKQEFYTALDQLSASAQDIAAHAGSFESSLDIVGRSLAENIDQLVANYKAGYENAGELYLVEAIDHCGSCHSQTPELHSSLQTDEFVRFLLERDVEVSMATRILVAVREFDEALSLWERHILNKDFLSINLEQRKLCSNTFHREYILGPI